MHRKRLHRLTTALIAAASIGLGACGSGASSPSSAIAAEAAEARAPSGTFESRLPDGTAIQLRFRDGGDVVIAMIEGGTTNTQDGKWIVNGQVILVEGGEGMMMQLSWRGDSLVTDFGGATLTFKEA